MTIRPLYNYSQGFLLSRPPTALTIAGSDSGGGAGIQADIKTFAALGCYGTSVITTVTAQNTMGVTHVTDLSVDSVASQIDAIAKDIYPNAVKTGMLSSVDIVETVVSKIKHHDMCPVVVDPVMVAASGARLITQDAVKAIYNNLIPIADVVTPNAYEANVLTGVDIRTHKDVLTACKIILEKGAKCVIIKGGHLKFNPIVSVDILMDQQGFEEFSTPRIDTKSTHGTGCTFASAICAGLAFDMNIRDATKIAKQYVTESIQHAPSIGSGNGPLSHLYGWWNTTITQTL